MLQPRKRGSNDGIKSYGIYDHSWPVGFWDAELTHAYEKFLEEGLILSWPLS